MRTILNVIIDEKFIDGVIESHDMVESNVVHRYCIVCNKLKRKLLGTNKLRYIKNSSRIEFIDFFIFNKFIKSNHIDAIILHGFGVLPPKLICKITKLTKVFWFAWGYDLYSLPSDEPFIQVNLYKDKTTNILKTLQYRRERNLRFYINKLKLKSHVIKDYYDAIKRVDYFSGVLEYEYDIMRQIDGFKAEKSDYIYVNPYIFKDYKIMENHQNKNILIGNSGAPENNHLDLISYLPQDCLEKRNILMPLSYGNIDYINYVKDEYNKVYGKKFIPLDTFMDYNNYCDKIKSCDVAIFFHERQQALGNINLFIKNGCKVFLSETSPVFNFYKSIGLTVFSIQKDLSKEELEQPLSKDAAYKNFTIMKNRYGLDRYKLLMNNIYKLI